MATHGEHIELGREPARQAMPRRVRWAVLGTLGVLLLGALYLIAVRGQAMLFDLTALSQRIFCF